MSVIRKPHNTEKLTLMNERPGDKQYAFVVDEAASKAEIKKEIEALYSVKVQSLRTLIYGGTKRSRFTKSGVIVGKTARYKKAIVTLAEGDQIDFFANI